MVTTKIVSRPWEDAKNPISAPSYAHFKRGAPSPPRSSKGRSLGKYEPISDAGNCTAVRIAQPITSFCVAVRLTLCNEPATIDRNTASDNDTYVKFKRSANKGLTIHADYARGVSPPDACSSESQTAPPRSRAVMALYWRAGGLPSVHLDIETSLYYTSLYEEEAKWRHSPKPRLRVEVAQGSPRGGTRACAQVERRAPSLEQGSKRGSSDHWEEF